MVYSNLPIIKTSLFAKRFRLNVTCNNSYWLSAC